MSESRPSTTPCGKASVAATTPTATDAALMTSHRQGDRGSFRLLVERHRGDLSWFLSKSLGQEEAQDACQDTFLKVHQSASHFDAGRKFRPWLYAIAANVARDRLRRRRRFRCGSLDQWSGPRPNEGVRLADAVADRSAKAPEVAAAREAGARVRGLAGKMRSPLKEIVGLYYFEQLSYRQISRVLGIPLGTVKSRLHAAVVECTRRWMAGAATGPHGASVAHREIAR